MTNRNKVSLEAMLNDFQERGYDVTLYRRDNIWRVGIHKERDDPCAYEDGATAFDAVFNGYIALEECETLGRSAYKLSVALRRLEAALGK